MTDNPWLCAGLILVAIVIGTILMAGFCDVVATIIVKLFRTDYDVPEHPTKPL